MLILGIISCATGVPFRMPLSYSWNFCLCILLAVPRFLLLPQGIWCISCMASNLDLVSFFCMWIPSFPNKVCLRYKCCLLFHVISWHFYQILCSCSFVVFFLGLLFCNIGLHSCFYTSNIQVLTLWLYNIVLGQARWHYHCWSFCLGLFWLIVPTYDL